MPAVGLIIGAASILGGISVAAGIIAVESVVFTTIALVVSGMIQVAMSLSTLLEGSPELPPEQAVGQQVNACEPMKSIPLIYGTQRVGINRVYMTTNGVNNKKLHIIGIICEGLINGIKTIDGVPQIFLDDRIYTDFGSDFTYEFFPGYPDDSNLCTTLKNATAGQYDAWDDPLHNTAYIYCCFNYNRDKFQGVPQISVVVEGLKVYDPRTDVTSFSNNPALIAYDFITRNRNRGGMGINSSRIVTSSVTDAATYCDNDGWTCDIVISDNKSAIDILQDILLTFRGDLIYSQCRFSITYRDLFNEAPVMSLDDNDVVETDDKSTLSIIQESIFDIPNAVKISYPNSENKYVVDNYLFVDSSALSIDGDYREKSINLSGVTNTSNVITLASYYRDRERICKKINFVAHSRCMALEPHDVITLSHTFPGWDDKLFRVTKTVLMQNGEVAISAIEESSVFYNDTYDMSTHEYYDTILPDPTSTIPNVINVNITEQQYYYGSRTFTRLLVYFSRPTQEKYPWWDCAEIWISVDGGVTYKNIGTSTTDFQIDPVEEGQTYYFKIRGINIWGAKETLDACYSGSYLVTGKTSAPTAPPPITVLASGDVITILTEEITDPDVEGYEIRLGDSWDGGIFIGIYRGATIRLAGFKPGNYTFWLSPKNNRGYYATTKRSGTVTVLYPANYRNISLANGWNVNTGTWTWDFASTGLYSNATNSTYGSTVIMKANHSSVTGFQNLDFSSGTSGWSTDGVSISTFSTGGVSGISLYSSQNSTAGNIYQTSTEVPKSQRIDVHFTYRNSSVTSTGWFQIYDVSRSTNLIAPVSLPQATVFSTYSTYFETDWETTGVLARFGVSTGSTGQSVDFVNISITPTTVLSGKWRSPVYDLGDKFKVRAWGDFRYIFIGSDQYWTAVPSSWTWEQVGSSSKRWYELTPVTQAGQINAKLLYGDSSDAMTSTVEYFQITAPEFYGRYLQVEVEIKDPDITSNIYLYNLNMNAAYWTTANT